MRRPSSPGFAIVQFTAHLASDTRTLAKRDEDNDQVAGTHIARPN